MVVNRINAWLVSRLPSRRSSVDIVVDDSGLQVCGRQGKQHIDWQDIAEIVATRTEQMVGSMLVLVIALKDGRTLTVAEDAPAWADLTARLPDYLVGAKPYQEWALHGAVSDEPRIVVYRS